MVRKIISGGQTGADRAGLEIARELGLETGGWAPKGWKTDAGPDPSLAEFGVREHTSAAYPPRTRANVRDADVTVWFGNPSPGKTCTFRACLALNKPFYDNPTPEQIRALMETCAVLNVAGNRERMNPGIGERVKAIIRGALQ